MLPALWGLDAAFAALCWAICATQCMQITMVADGPLLLLTASVWVCTILMRVRNAIRQSRGLYHEYYESHAMPMLVLAACVSAAGIWMLLYYVGKDVLSYAFIPLVLLLPSVGLFRQDSAFKRLCRSLALGFACLAPAFSMSFEVSSLHMFFRAPCWYVGILFFLFQQERTWWQEDAVARNSHSRLLVVGLFCLLGICTLSVGGDSYFERTMSLTTAMGAACLLLLAKMRPFLNGRTHFCLCWPIMTLPALLSLLIFHPWK